MLRLYLDYIIYDASHLIIIQILPGHRNHLQIRISCKCGQRNRYSPIRLGVVTNAEYDSLSWPYQLLIGLSSMELVTQRSILEF